MRRLVGLIALVLVAGGCSEAAGTRAARSWQVFAAEGRVDYQLGGAYPPAGDVRVLVRDRSASPVAGLYNICYVNGFQTQPDEAEQWLKDHPDLVLRDAGGEPVRDPGWPDELALDTSTAAHRTEIADIVSEQIAGCAAAGYQGVELDNLDSWTRFEALTVDDNLALAVMLIATAHEAGLAVGQKNAVELAERGPEVGFDFAISEQCTLYDECEAYAEQYGAAHIDVEYVDDLPEGTSFEELCKTGQVPPLTVLRDLLLVSAGDPQYRYQHC